MLAHLHLVDLSWWAPTRLALARATRLDVCPRASSTTIPRSACPERRPSDKPARRPASLPRPSRRARRDGQKQLGPAVSPLQPRSRSRPELP